ncbi:MAG: type II secretion system minor pseudopilin GspI [Candidatus Sedimenticola sp. (ex Thyasira tokunagai)]
MNRYPIQKGFTLIEVVVALAVLTIAMTALIKAAGSNAANQTYLEERTFASWVAVNHLNAARISDEQRVPGSFQGSETMAGREWRWHLQTSTTSDPQVLRAEIEVTPADSTDKVMANLSGYLEAGK